MRREARQRHIVGAARDARLVALDYVMKPFVAAAALAFIR
jgi:hypothetical protein